ncbi:serine/threonine-protein kinase [Accumulibacter sp.]|uniref:serine/threonine-protein kinase n=1 Tax=Accumulibacter sp. TaxID=2053492 RepID=UPI00258B07CE|nr:serine/threonine-protein kinase [Accumulibacter sp.]
MSEPEDYDPTWSVRPQAAPSPPAVEAAAGGDIVGNALRLGTKIGEFEITDLIGIGGFGIVYLAHDHSLGRNVALKEYMPWSLAARVDGLTVVVKSARLAETFAIGLRSFVNEARMLAQFDHRSLVKVYRFWEANGTAYMIMPFYEGVTLKHALQKMPGPPDEDWLRAVIDPLLEALEVLHKENCFHRDIAPDNILLLADGRPVLLDFGAARRVISDRTQALTVILKPGYAPLEQYAEESHDKQGAWTDIYALSAVVYNAITGRPPTPSVGRTIKDTMVPLTQAAAGRYNEGFLHAIDRGLAVRPEDRPQTIAEFRSLLAKKERPNDKPPGLPPETATPMSSGPVTEKRSKVALYTGLAGAMMLIAGGAFYAIRSTPDSTPSQAPPAAVAPSATTEARSAGTSVTQQATAAKPATAPAESSATPTAHIQTADRKGLTEQQLVELLLGKNGTTSPSDGTVKPFDPVDMLQEIYQQRDQEHVVAVVPEKAKVRIDQDKLRFRVSSLKPGYLYILMVGTDHKQFNLLFPNAIDADNGIAGDGELNLPRPGWAMTAAGPPGVNRFVAIVSENRRDFTTAGLKKVDPFAEFPIKVAERIAREPRSGAGNPFAGKVVCPAGRRCSASYGAALFAIEEVN